MMYRIQLTLENTNKEKELYLKNTFPVRCCNLDTTIWCIGYTYKYCSEVSIVFLFDYNRLEKVVVSADQKKNECTPYSENHIIACFVASKNRFLFKCLFHLFRFCTKNWTLLKEGKAPFTAFQFSFQVPKGSRFSFLKRLLKKMYLVYYIRFFRKQF